MPHSPLVTSILYGTGAAMFIGQNIVRTIVNGKIKDAMQYKPVSIGGKTVQFVKDGDSILVRGLTVEDQRMATLQDAITITFSDSIGRCDDARDCSYFVLLTSCCLKL